MADTHNYYEKEDFNFLDAVNANSEMPPPMKLVWDTLYCGSSTLLARNLNELTEDGYLITMIIPRDDGQAFTIVANKVVPVNQ